MKVNESELRIGNYVNEPKGHLHKVERTSEDSSRERHSIPLTEEWLIKFGFEVHHEENQWFKTTVFPSYRRESAVIHIQLRDDEQAHVYTVYSSWPISPPIKYVHELQNLFFALSHEELTIK